MEIIIEVIAELAFEITSELSANKKISKWIRYPLIFLLSLFVIAIIGMFFVLGFMLILKNDNISKFVGIFFLILGIALLISSIKSFRVKYLNYKDK